MYQDRQNQRQMSVGSVLSVLGGLERVKALDILADEADQFLTAQV